MKRPWIVAEFVCDKEKYRIVEVDLNGNRKIEILQGGDAMGTPRWGQVVDEDYEHAFNSMVKMWPTVQRIDAYIQSIEEAVAQGKTKEALLDFLTVHHIEAE